MTEVLATKGLGGIYPANDEAKDVFAKWPKDQTLLVDVKIPRNAQFHRKFFALLNLTLDNQNTYTSLEELRTAVTLDAGFYDVVTLINGAVHLKPKSIKFAAMNEEEFSQLYSAVIDSCLKLLPGTTSEEIEREIAAF